MTRRVASSMIRVPAGAAVTVGQVIPLFKARGGDGSRPAPALVAAASAGDRLAQPVYGQCPALHPVFTLGRENACPACNARSWFVGRTTAECARCGSPLLIVQGVDCRGRA